MTLNDWLNDGMTAHNDQLNAALRDIAATSYRYWHELQVAGFTKQEAWEVMIAWNEQIASGLCRPSS